MILQLSNLQMHRFGAEFYTLLTLASADVSIVFSEDVFYKSESLQVGSYAITSLLDHAKSMLGDRMEIYLDKPDLYGGLNFVRDADDKWRVLDCEDGRQVAILSTEEVLDEIVRFAALVARLISYHHGNVSPEALMPSDMPDELRNRLDRALVAPLPPFGEKQEKRVDPALKSVGWVLGPYKPKDL